MPKDYVSPASEDASWKFVDYVSGFPGEGSVIIEVDLCGDPGEMITEMWYIEMMNSYGSLDRIIRITDALGHTINFASVANILDFRVKAGGA